MTPFRPSPKRTSRTTGHAVAEEGMSDFLDPAGAGSAIWIMGLFLGVAYWAFRPGRRAQRPPKKTTSDDHGKDGA